MKAIKVSITDPGIRKVARATFPGVKVEGA